VRTVGLLILLTGTLLAAGCLTAGAGSTAPPESRPVPGAASSPSIGAEAARAAQDETSGSRRSGEMYRLRVHNRRGGLVQVSLDSGRTYWTVGRVLHPANARIIGFAAASYTSQGTVAAVAVHGIRIKTGQCGLGRGKAQMPLVFSIVPVQFASIPKGYGGHIPRSSAVITDVFAGRSIFRNLSPYVGSRVYLERNRALEALPEDYAPLEGDTFVIKVEKPADLPAWIEFENRVGGAVTAFYTDGRTRLIAKVLRPVWGIGRYDGTTFTGVGAINTNHPGVITISTAPAMPPDTKEGGPVETRGGFMIQPSAHAREQHEASPQVMVVGPAGESAPRLEGTPPLFFGGINLSFYLQSPQASYRVQVRVDDWDWQDVPQMVGKCDDAFRASGLRRRFASEGRPCTITRGVTAFRLLFPNPDPKLLAQDLALESADYTRRTTPAGAPTVKGKFTIAPRREPADGSTLTFCVDGTSVYTVNHSPYEYRWDSSTVPNGIHLIEIELAGASGRVLIERREVVVEN